MPGLQLPQNGAAFIETVDGFVPLDPIEQFGDINDQAVNCLGEFGRHDGGGGGKTERRGMLVRTCSPDASETSLRFAT